MKRLCEIVKEIEAANPQTTIGKKEIELLRRLVGFEHSANQYNSGGIDQEALAAFDKHIGPKSSFDFSQAFENPEMASYTGDALDELLNSAFDLLYHTHFETLKSSFGPQEISILRNIQKKFNIAMKKANDDRRARTGALI